MKWSVFGLWLNVERSRFQWAGAVMAGYGAAMTKEQLDPIWGDAHAKTNCPAEADNWLFDVNERKMTAQLFVGGWR